MPLVSKFLEAANYTKGRPGGPPRGIVIHDEEFPEKVTSAEEIAAFFHNQPKNIASGSSSDNPRVTSGGSSAHYTTDSDSIVQCVRDEDTAWDAPPNTEWPHLGFEHDGFAHQTRAQWLDAHGQKMLRLSARLAAKKSAQLGIPVRRLSLAQLRNHEKGFAGHVDVSSAFGFSDHHDPGPGFPWDWYLTRVRRYRWRYFHYVLLDSAGKKIGTSDTVREGDGRLQKALGKLLADKTKALAGKAKAIIKRERVF